MTGPTTPLPAGQIRKGMHAVLKDRPCRILSVKISKTGKHGHAKAHFHGVDVFTDKKYEDICPSTHTMQVPVLDRAEYDLIDEDDGRYVSLMDTDGEIRADLQVPDSPMGEEITALFEKLTDISVTVLSWGDYEEAIISYKVVNN